MREPPPELLLRVCDSLRAGPALRRAVLFGSQAKGTAKSRSDFDIGIIPVENLSMHEELSLASLVSGVLESEVDLVRLDEDNPLLGREVARTGICLLEDKPGAFAAYRATAMSCWLDFEETVAPHRENFLRRLSEKRP